MEFTKEQTNVAKGIAICLMFVHHLYTFSDRLLNGNYYIPLLPPVNLELTLGKFGNICIAMFLFLSGYGMFWGWKASQKSALAYSWKKLKDFYFTYWLYFLVFVPIGLVFFPYRTLWNSNQQRFAGDISTFLQNLVGWSATYNDEWWFARTFIPILALLTPLYLRLVERNLTLLVFISLALFGLSLKVNPSDRLGFIFWQASFTTGLICARYRFFSGPVIQHLEKLHGLWAWAGLALCFVLRFRLGVTTEGFGVSTERYTRADFLLVPLVVYFGIRVVSLMRLERIFAYLGYYSFPLWLVHSFFCYYYLQDLVYAPHWSPLVFILLTGLSLASVLAIEQVRSLSGLWLDRWVKG